MQVGVIHFVAALSEIHDQNLNHHLEALLKYKREQDQFIIPKKDTTVQDGSESRE